MRAILILILGLIGFPAFSLAAESVTKSLSYVVVGTSTDKESVSKMQGYAVVGTSTNSETSSKFLSYLVVGTNTNSSSVTKVLAYLVVDEGSSITQPNIYIFSRNDRTCFEGRSALYPSAECNKPYDLLRAVASTH